MRCAVSFLSVIVLVIGVGIAAFFIIWTTDEDYLRATEHTNFTCPERFTKCDENETSSLCIPNYKKCDNVYDCPNGMDEQTMDCKDMKDTMQWIMKAYYQCASNSTNSSSTPRKQLNYSKNASVPVFPEGCKGSDVTIYCNNTKIDSSFLQNIQTSVVTLTLHSILDIAVLNQELVPSMNNNIKRLYLENNTIHEVGESAFCNWNKACWLNFNHNNIAKIRWDSFCEMKNLSSLSMSGNSLTLEGFNFSRVSGLRNLFLDNNQITIISKELFASLTSLKTLKLNENWITYIHEDAFVNNIHLEEIYLTNNRLKQLLPTVFINQKNMTRLYLGGNPLESIPGKVFTSLESLGSLNVEGVRFEIKDLLGLMKLKHLDYVKFLKFGYCKYVPAASRCYPSSDSITTVMNLLAGTSVRYIVWIVATLTILGNLVVLFSRECCGKQGRILDVFVKNLAGADFLMGVYLIILAVKDLEYRNSYNIYAYQWGTSYLCSFIGVLAMISSEVSLLILTIISVERCLVICFSYNPESKMLSVNLARFLMGIIWIFVIILAVAPAIQWRGKLSFYGSTGLCFPIHLDDPYSVGWQYTSFVIVGMNTICLVIVAVCYSTLFYAVRRTTKRAARIVPNKDMEMALKCFLMIFTDCLCWLPIIVLKIYTLSGNHIRKELITWVIIFVLPINSAINPFLYTFSMPNTRMVITRRLHQLSSGRFSRNLMSLSMRHPRSDHVEPDECSRGNSWQSTSNTTNTTSGSADASQNSHSRLKNRLVYQDSIASK